jgi:hypothetical protein
MPKFVSANLPFLRAPGSTTAYFTDLLESLMRISQVVGLSGRLDFALPTGSSLDFLHFSKIPLNHSLILARNLGFILDSFFFSLSYCTSKSRSYQRDLQNSARV